MADNALNVVQDTRCDNLRWKGLFTDSEADPNASHHFWCAKTQFGLGPDGQPVDHSECKPGRSCYREL